MTTDHWNVNNESEDDEDGEDSEDGEDVREDGLHVK